MSIFWAAPLPRLRSLLPVCMLACVQASACAKPAASVGPQAPYRLAPELSVCFCQSSHKTAVLSSRAQLDEWLASAPCTSRGDGAEERAREWSGRCLRAVAEAGLDFEKEAAMAKYYASDVAMRAAVEGVQIFGGNGYMKEYPAERHMSDAKICQIYEGTNEIQRVVVARKLIGLR